MKSFIKFFVLLLFTFTVVIACKPEAQITTEPEEQDDLTLLNNVTCMFSDEEIAKLSETISDPDNYYFSTGNYTCQFLTTIDTQETKIIDSCILFSETVRSTYNDSYSGTLSKSSHNTVVIASSKSSKNEYDPDVLETVLWDSNGMHWDGWKGLIGSYSDANPHALYGKTVADLFKPGMLITQGATTME